MSVENKIKELLERVGIAEGANLQEADEMGAGSVGKDQSIKAANSGDTSAPRQGSSQDADYEERDEEEENHGAIVSKNIKQNGLTANGPGAAPNFMDTGIAPKVQEEAEETGMEIKEQLSLIFGDTVSEEFQEKATAIFEAAVIARVNNEMAQITEALVEQAEQELAEAKEEMIEKVDSFLNYVVEQWIQENELAVDAGLRTEITEDFITGLKNLFQEHYIEVPEEKYEVLEELQADVISLEQKLDDVVNENIELSSSLIELVKERIIEEQAKGLAETEAEKLRKLVEGVQFDDADLFAEKVTVIKENYFPKNSVQRSKQTLTEDVTPVEPHTNDVMSKYVQTLSRGLKTR